MAIPKLNLYRGVNAVATTRKTLDSFYLKPQGQDLRYRFVASSCRLHQNQTNNDSGVRIAFTKYVHYMDVNNRSAGLFLINNRQSLSLIK